MSYAQDTGYTPRTIPAIMEDVRVRVNAAFGLTYDEATFAGTNWYKYFYLQAQLVEKGEITTSQVFQKLQDYIQTTNDKINRPSVSYPGVVEAFEDAGFLASIKPPELADAGKVGICVDLDNGAPDYPAKKTQVLTLLSQFFAAGMVFLGSETGTVVVKNGQSMPFAFSLPNRIQVVLRLTFVKSPNSLIDIPSDEVIRQTLFDNIAARYKLGYQFEPQRYFTQSEALWASTVKLEWSNDSGVNWHQENFAATYIDVFTFELDDINVVIS